MPRGSDVPEQKFAMKITATAEVRDADGNLISAEPVEFDLGTLTETEVRALTEGPEPI